MPDNQPIVSFHGPDGCGKSTIARHLHEISTDEREETLCIGSGDPLEWLTPEIYARYIGSTERLEQATTPNAPARALVNLYEDAAVCLFGIAQDHATSRGRVFIHSDPYLKRLAWAKKYFGSDGFWEYADRFDRYMSERVGDIFASHVVVIRVDAEDAFNRINQRGIVEKFDPATKEENTVLVEAVDFVEDAFLGAARPYERLQRTKVYRIENPSTTPQNQHIIIDSICKVINEIAV